MRVAIGDSGLCHWCVCVMSFKHYLPPLCFDSTQHLFLTDLLAQINDDDLAFILCYSPLSTDSLCLHVIPHE